MRVSSPQKKKCILAFLLFYFLCFSRCVSLWQAERPVVDTPDSGEYNFVKFIKEYTRPKWQMEQDAHLPRFGHHRTEVSIRIYT